MVGRSLAEKQAERLFPRHQGVCQVRQQDVFQWAQDKTNHGTHEDEGVKAHRPTYSLGSVWIGAHLMPPPTSSLVVMQCFILGLEVLDNLPHDKIVWVKSDGDKGLWSLHETIVM